MTFGDVLEVVERPVDLIDDVEYQLVTAKRSRGGVVARSRLLGRDVLTKTQFQIARDDFLMSNRQIIHGGCGIVPPALDGAVVSNEYSVLRPKSKLLLEFLGYLSHSIYFQQTCFHASVGVDVEKMIFDCERWLEFKIHLPPLQEQRRIAEILSSVDEAVAATRAVIEQTRKVKQGVLERLLTKGIGQADLKESSLGLIPSSWRVTTLSAVVELSGGAGFPIKYQGHEGLPFPFIKVSDMNLDGNEKHIRTWNNTIDQSIAYELRAKPFRAGSVIFPKVGAALLTNKRRILTQSTFVDNNVMVASPTAKIDSEFLYYLLCRMDFAEFVQPGAVPSVNQAQVGALAIAVPPLDEQREIVSTLLVLDRSIENQVTSIIQSSEIKYALMSDLLTGRKRVTDALPMAAE